MLGTSIIINKKQPGPPVKLSLVALMDIFTILVFFLLLNSGDSQTLEDAKFVKLPDSSAETAPHSELVIYVGDEAVWLADEEIVKTSEVMKAPDKVIEPLSLALESHAAKYGTLNNHESKNGLAIVVMADQSVPYSLLKSVMATCSGQNFRDISLAVNRVAAEVYGGGGQL